MIAAPGTGSTSRSRQSPHQSVDAVRRKPRSLSIEVRSEPAHLIFEGRERADVKHPPRLLLIECCDWLGADDLAARGVDGGIRDIRIDHAQCGLDHAAPIVYLGDNAVGFMLAIQRYCGLRPFGRCIMA